MALLLGLASSNGLCLMQACSAQCLRSCSCRCELGMSRPASVSHLNPRPWPCGTPARAGAVAGLFKRTLPLTPALSALCLKSRNDFRGLEMRPIGKGDKMIRTSQVPYLGHEGHGVAVLLLGLRRRVQAGLQDCAGVQVQGAEAHLRLPKLLLHGLALCMGQDSEDRILGQLCIVCISLFLVLLRSGEIPGLCCAGPGCGSTLTSP